MLVFELVFSKKLVALIKARPEHVGQGAHLSFFLGKVPQKNFPLKNITKARD